jgi:hypothetical protein
MALSDHASITITAGTKTPSRSGFGTALILDYHANFTPGELVRSYTSVAGMVSDGFVSGTAAYAAASAIAAQSPRPPRWKVGLLSSAPTVTYTFTVPSAVQGTVYTLTINGTAYSYTVGAAATTTTVATALAALWDPNANVAASATGAVVTVTPTVAGKRIRFEGWGALLYKETTADPGVAAALDAILAADPDFYFVALTGQGDAELAAASAWCETNKRIFLGTVHNSLAKSAGSTTDYAYTASAASRDCTVNLYNGNDTFAFSALAWGSQRGTATPGSDTWKFKGLSSVTADGLTDSEVSALKAKRCNVYVTTSGVAFTAEGVTCGTDFADTVRFLHWLEAEMAVRILNAKLNAAKIPYTNKGVDRLESVVRGTLRDGANAGGLVPSTITVDVTDVEDVDEITRASREYPGLSFTARLAGAIHKTTVTGLVTV